MSVRLVSTITVVLGLSAWLVAAPAEAQKPVAIGTNPPGTAFYGIGSGIAKVATDAGALNLSVQPYAGSSTFLPLLDSGEMEFGVNNAVDMALAYRGPRFKIGGKNPFPHTPNVRLVTRGSPFMVALLVKKDSPIKSVHDIKGKRMTGEYRAHLAVWYNMFGHLATAGLTWDDVTVVPVPGINEGLEALVQGRAEVTEYALNAAKVREADAQVGVRHVTNDCSPAGEKRLREAVPGYYPAWVKKGGAAAVVDDVCVIAYDVYITAGKGVTDAQAETLLRAIWDNTDKLAPLHPIFKRWTRERMPTHDVTMPYHPGAIRFFKEKGVWTPEMEKAQQQLLSLNPR
ncbi:MAG: TAXI family TRAP transporter solute-binding subunit [Candidatus Rokubacteria bacterium]|nr:TAXI family TRAP transporter solute-binding subunit [Candidatus Rokubacteria bacterium]